MKPLTDKEKLRRWKKLAITRARLLKDAKIEIEMLSMSLRNATRGIYKP